MESSMSMSKILLLASFVVIGVGFVIIYFWKADQSMEYILQLFSFKQLKEDIVLGVLMSLLLLFILTMLILFKKVDLPRTETVELLVDFARQKKTNVFIISVVTVLAEEFFFRGVILMIGISLWPAWSWVSVITVSILFTILHVEQYKGQTYILSCVFLFSVLAGVATMEQLTIWSALIIHFIYNFVFSMLVRANLIKIVKEETMT